MSKIEIIIDKAHDGFSVKSFVRNHLKVSSRVFIKQKYAENGLMINNKCAKSIDILHEGDLFVINIVEEQHNYEAVKFDLDILYEDTNFLIINKPAGISIHSSHKSEKNTILSAVAYYYKNNGESFVFRSLYRLDKDTSGILVIAKNRLAASSVTLDKTYFAVCEGELFGSGTISSPIKLKEGSIIEREIGFGVSAVTHWKAINTEKDYTFLKVRLETGRTHQIRVHFASINHPLAGDDLYGGSRKYIKRQALHCGELEIFSSVLNLKKKIVVDFPSDIKTVFQKFNII